MRNKGRLEKKEDIKEGETMDYKLTVFLHLRVSLAKVAIVFDTYLCRKKISYKILTMSFCVLTRKKAHKLRYFLSLNRTYENHNINNFFYLFEKKNL